MNRMTFSSILLAVILLGLGSQNAWAQYEITVTAGAYDRMGSVVSFTLPDDVEAGTYTLQSESGESAVLQVDKQNRGSFILDQLSAGSTRRYTLDLDAATAGDNTVNSSYDHNTITFSDGQSEVLSYYYRQNELPKGMHEMYHQAGYIHPVYSPDGVPLTNHLDPKVHTHHYGIWAAWTNTEFQGRTPDFWNPDRFTGRIDHADSVETAWEGPVHAGLTAMNYYVDISSSAPVIALNEKWKLVIYNSPENSDYHMFDLVLTHTTNTAQPLVLPEYRYGGLAFRGHAEWDNPENVTFLTSEGNDRSNGNETRARWAHMGGLVQGQRAGIAVLGHPDNFRAPQPIRVHPETPYFVWAPMQLGEMKIEPGSPYVMRYRFITHDGKPDPEELERLWRDYAYPLGVSVTK